jgi:FdhD protein
MPGERPEQSSSQSLSIVRYESGVARPDRDEVAREEPLEIRVRGRAVSVTMRTPGHDQELAFGFLLSEGIIRRQEDMIRAEPCGRNDDGNLLNVVLAPEVPVDFERLTRHVFASSSCGLCGKATIDAVRGQFPKLTGGATITPRTLLSLPAKMREAQATFSRTGGLHAAALFTTSGDLIVLREDVGRHNAVDKVLGHALANRQTPLAKAVLLVSGRTSFEILQKALSASIPIVAAVSAPSSLAVEFAQESGQTLVGFLREGRMNVYAHPQRLTGVERPEA